MEWECNADNGQIVAGGNGEGNIPERVNCPTDVIVDIKNDSLTICDRGNRRVVLWPYLDDTTRTIIMSLTIDISMSLTLKKYEFEER
jgi:hypothetical protein